MAYSKCTPTPDTMARAIVDGWRNDMSRQKTELESEFAIGVLERRIAESIHGDRCNIAKILRAMGLAD